MLTSRPVIGLVFVVLSMTAAAAKPLTCEQFKDRFGGALLATGEKGVDVPAFTMGFSDPVRGNRYDWSTFGLSGTLKCGADNQFEEMFVNATFASRDQFADTLQHFITVAGASICALATNGAGACAEFGRSMLQDSLEQIGRAYNRGVTRPSGLTDRDLFPGAKAELTAAATLVTLLVGPGRGASMDDARQPLNPVPAKPPQ